jgi:hypothetical protein
MATHLDEEVVELLSKTDSFFFQQRLQLIETITQGCWEQPNVYDVFDRTTNKRIMIIKEESHDCSRCMCAPGHSLYIKFYLMDKDAPELVPGQKVDWSYSPSAPPFMTMEREGCDCGGPCPKPCIGCFACTEGCSESAAFYAGDLSGEAGSLKGGRERTKLIGESVQPKLGGGTRPVMQAMERADANDSKGATQQFAAVQGPACFGGCIKLCCNAEFKYGKAAPTQSPKSVTFENFAQITKLRPKELGQGAREMFTDSDLFDVQFINKDITPQQKAAIMAQLIHMDYMFFENDNDICSSEGLTLFNCFCCGCVCPCKIQKGEGG